MGGASPSFLPAAENLVRLLSDLDLCPLKSWNTDSHQEMSKSKRRAALTDKQEEEAESESRMVWTPRIYYDKVCISASS